EEDRIVRGVCVRAARPLGELGGVAALTGGRIAEGIGGRGTGAAAPPPAVVSSSIIISVETRGQPTAVVRNMGARQYGRTEGRRGVDPLTAGRRRSVRPRSTRTTKGSSSVLPASVAARRRAASRTS